MINISKTRMDGRRVPVFLLRADAALTVFVGRRATWAFLIWFTLASRAHPIS
jgi:hypothetical protein